MFAKFTLRSVPAHNPKQRTIGTKLVIKRSEKLTQTSPPLCVGFAPSNDPFYSFEENFYTLTPSISIYMPLGLQ